MSDDQVKLVIDRGLCIGYGECVGEAPDAVALGEDGCARVLVSSLTRPLAERLCAACPTGAISIDP